MSPRRRRPRRFESIESHEVDRKIYDQYNESTRQYVNPYDDQYEKNHRANHSNQYDTAHHQRQKYKEHNEQYESINVPKYSVTLKAHEVPSAIFGHREVNKSSKLFHHNALNSSGPKTKTDDEEKLQSVINRDDEIKQSDSYKPNIDAASLKGHSIIVEEIKNNRKPKSNFGYYVHQEERQKEKEQQQLAKQEEAKKALNHLKEVKNDESISRREVDNSKLDLKHEDHEVNNDLLTLSKALNDKQVTENEHNSAKELSSKEERFNWNKRTSSAKTHKLHQQKWSFGDDETASTKQYMDKVLQSNVYKLVKSKLGVAIGYNKSGTHVISEMNKMPHILMVGRNCESYLKQLDIMMLSMFYRNTVNQLKLSIHNLNEQDILSASHFESYEELPYLAHPINTKTDRLFELLHDLSKEISERKRIFGQMFVSNLYMYNQKVSHDQQLPSIIVMINGFDQINLNASQFNQFEKLMNTLTLQGKAYGIHFVLMTNKPSKEILTHNIRQYVKTRIAFNVRDVEHSMYTIGRQGAEILEDDHSFLYVSHDANHPNILHQFELPQSIKEEAFKKLKMN